MTKLLLFADSFQDGMLAPPVYTLGLQSLRTQMFLEILLSGNKAKIEELERG